MEFLWLSIQLGMSSSPLTNSYFSEGLKPPTRLQLQNAALFWDLRSASPSDLVGELLWARFFWVIKLLNKEQFFSSSRMRNLTNIFSWIGIGEIIRAETTGFHSGWLVHAPWIQDEVYEKMGSIGIPYWGYLYNTGGCDYGYHHVWYVSLMVEYQVSVEFPLS